MGSLKCSNSLEEDNVAYWARITTWSGPGSDGPNAGWDITLLLVVVTILIVTTRSRWLCISLFAVQLLSETNHKASHSGMANLIIRTHTIMSTSRTNYAGKYLFSCPLQLLQCNPLPGLRLFPLALAMSTRPLISSRKSCVLCTTFRLIAFVVAYSNLHCDV
jgi:hypothetical protein